MYRLSWTLCIAGRQIDELPFQQGFAVAIENTVTTFGDYEFSAAVGTVIPVSRLVSQVFASS